MADTTPDRAPAAGFCGYPLPVSNTTYVPNQFFDVVLRHASRGAVRVVSYLIRRTLGWSDADGNPLEEVVSVSHRELARNANVSRGALSAALREAQANRYIVQTVQARPARRGEPHASGAYALRWHASAGYVKAPEEFGGFYSGEGNRTYVPNAFFDHTVRHESLAVVKAVGAIIRHTIGFQTAHGFRRQRVRLSYRDLERYTQLSPRHLSAALRQALEGNHICLLERGCFDPDAGRESRAAVYGLRWADGEGGSKRMADTVAPFAQGRIKKDSGLSPGGLKRIAVGRIRNVSGSGSEREAGGRIEKDSGTEIKQEITPSQTTTAAAVERLLQEGFARRVAGHLAERFPAERVFRQCDLLARRHVRKNRLGLLRKAIEEDWPAPEPSPAPARSGHRPPNSAQARRAVEKPKHRIPGRRCLRQDTGDAAHKLRELEQSLQHSRPDLWQAFAKKEAEERRRIEQMPMVGRQFVQAILQSFDAAERRAGRLKSFIEEFAPDLPSP